jgi:hypothetical protein
MTVLEPPIGFDEQIKELEREIAKREEVFPRWVEQGRLKQAVAERRILCLRTTLELVRNVAARAGR